MNVEDKIKKLIEVSKVSILALKRKMIVTKRMKDHKILVNKIYKIQSSIFILSEMLKNFDRIRENYSDKDLKRFFENIKAELQEAKTLIEK